jgi:hypothetical protein
MALRVLVGPIPFGRARHVLFLNRQKRFFWIPRWWRTQFGDLIVAAGRFHISIVWRTHTAEPDPGFPTEAAVLAAAAQRREKATEAAAAF